MLRVSWPEYLFDPFQQLLSPSTSGDRPRSHRRPMAQLLAEEMKGGIHHIILLGGCKIALKIAYNKNEIAGNHA